MFLTADDAQVQIIKAVEDAKTRMGHSQFQVLSWPQTWGNSGCGFGGIVCHAFSDAQTVIVSGDTDNVLVYHKGRFAYEVRAPNEQFWIDCGQRRLPGAYEWDRVAAKYDASVQQAGESPNVSKPKEAKKATNTSRATRRKQGIGSQGA